MNDLSVTIVGHVTMDKNITPLGKTYSHPGGPPLYCCRFFKGMGTKLRIATTYGPDWSSGCIEGSDIFPPSPDAENTLSYENIYAKDRRIQKVMHFSETRLPSPDDFPPEFYKSGIIIFSPLTDTDGYEYAKKLSGKFPGSLKVILPQGYLRQESNGIIKPRIWEDASRILGLFDFAVLSEEDIDFDESRVRDWSKHGTGIILTRNGKGAVFFQGEIKGLFPSFMLDKKEIFDSTGAGDIFAAAFSLEYARTGRVNRSMTFAHAAAAMSLRTSPDKLKYTVGEIEDFINSTERRKS